MRAAGRPFTRRRRDGEDRGFLPDLRRDDDLFLVEFPKSGVTWLTFLMANVNLQLSRDPRQVTFFNVNDFIPELGGGYGGDHPLPVPGHRIFKSHSPFTRQYRKAFYLVRDPRDVMVSYAAFLNELDWWRGGLDKLIAHPRYGIEAWAAHVGGWLDHVDAATSFTLIRYEDLLADTAGELRRLYQLLGFALEDELLATAIARSSMDRMRDSERLARAGHPQRQALTFVREGQAGGARAPLADHLRRAIEEKAGPMMERLGYTAAA